MTVRKTDLSIMCTQFAGLLAFAQNAQANLRRLSVDDRAALDAEFKARKGGAVYGLADALRVVNKAAQAMYEAAKAAEEEDK